MSKYGTPNFKFQHCTREMKLTPYQRYCKDNFTDYKTWLGIRIDEPRRLKKMESKQIDFFNTKNKKSNIHYLAEISEFEKQDVLDWWSKMPFDLELKASDINGNCMFCIKRGVNKIALSARYEPEYAADFIKIIYDDSVRITDRKLPSDLMYRDNLSLVQIIQTYKDIPTHEIEQSIRSMKQLDSGSCSESCEAFSSDNLDLL